MGALNEKAIQRLFRSTKSPFFDNLETFSGSKLNRDSISSVKMEIFVDLPLDLQILTSHYLIHHEENETDLKGTREVLEFDLKDQLTVIYYLDSLSQKSLDWWIHSTPLEQYDQNFLLSAAVFSKNIRMIHFFLSIATNLDNDGGMPYLTAVVTGDEDILNILLNHVDKSESLRAAYIAASEYGNLKMFELLKKKWIILEGDESEISIDGINVALKGGHISFVKTVFNDLKEIPSSWLSSLLSRATYSRSTDLVKFLIERGADPTRRPEDLFDESRTLEMTELIYQYNPHVTEELIKSCFHHALMRGFADIAQFWVDHGKKITKGDLHSIIKMSADADVETLEFLYKHGADVTLDNNQPLMNAAQYNKVDNIRFLLSKGADIHAAREHALRIAIVENHFDSVRFLIMNGADFLINSFEKLGHKEIAEYLYSQVEKRYMKGSIFDWFF